MINRVPKTTFAHKIRGLTGPGYSPRNVTHPKTERFGPKGWSRSLYSCRLRNIGHIILGQGCPLKYVREWQTGQNNLKVTASHHTPTGRTLVYLDLDTHDGKGKIDHALKLLDLACAKLPHGAPLVTDRGVSAWVVVEYAETTNRIRHQPRAVEYNQTIDQIQNYLRGLAAANNLELSAVEAHGKVIETRGDEVLRCPDLMKCPTGELNLGRPVTWSTLRDTDWTAPVAAPKKKAKLGGGSRIKHRISEAQLAGLDNVAAMVDVWFPDRPTRSKDGDSVISARRFAEVLLVIVSSRPNKDLTMPFAMHEAAGRHLYAEGHFTRQWEHEVYEVVRDYLSDKGLNVVYDRHYTPPLKDKDGKVLQKGIAAKWESVDWFRTYVTSVAEKGQLWDSVTTRSAPLRGQDPSTLRSGGQEFSMSGEYPAHTHTIDSQSSPYSLQGDEESFRLTPIYAYPAPDTVPRETYEALDRLWLAV